MSTFKNRVLTDLFFFFQKAAFCPPVPVLPTVALFTETEKATGFSGLLGSEFLPLSGLLCSVSTCKGYEM